MTTPLFPVTPSLAEASQLATASPPPEILGAGFRFASAIGAHIASVAYHLCRTVKSNGGRATGVKLPVIVILGPRGSGKTELIRRLSDDAPSVALSPLSWIPRRVKDQQAALEEAECDVVRELNEAARHGVPFLIFDDASEVVAESTAVREFVSAETWTCKPFGVPVETAYTPRALVIVAMQTGCELHNEAALLNGPVLLIELESREG